MIQHVRPLGPEIRARLRPAPGARASSAFRSTWGATLALLERELVALGVREYVLQIDVTDADLRLDGGLRANARPTTPTVGLSFDTRKVGPLLFVCDRFIPWQDNVRAIALSLEALRKVDRYGITQSGEQYRGYQALPPGPPQRVESSMTIDEAAAFIARAAWPREADDYQARWVHRIVEEPAFRSEQYRRAAARLHPDAPTGNADEFRRLTDARDLLARAL
jgi:hypothetical protein